MNNPCVLASSLHLMGPDAVIFFLLFALFGGGFFLWMVVDCACNETPENNQKLVWLLVILFVPLGAFLYYFIRKRTRVLPVSAMSVVPTITQPGCPHCGASPDARATMCPVCGEPLPAQSPAPRGIVR